MQINSSDPKRLVYDYDFNFVGGSVIPLTVDPMQGDQILGLGEEFPIIRVSLTAKPSLTDPDTLLPAEEVSIYKTHLLAVQKRTREITPLSADEKAEWTNTIKELTNSVH